MMKDWCEMGIGNWQFGIRNTPNNQLTFRMEAKFQIPNSQFQTIVSLRQKSLE
jgi:hypothetical protein